MSSEAALKRMEEKIDRNQEGIASNREMIVDNRKIIDQVHQTVVLIEKVHGEKLEALMDGYDVLSNRFYRVEQRMDMQRMCIDDFEQNFVRLETGQQEIKRTVEQLVSIVSNHEDRLQNPEKKDGS